MNWSFGRFQNNPFVDAVLRWLQGLGCIGVVAGLLGGCSPATDSSKKDTTQSTPTPQLSRRLTPTQYNNTVYDLLYLDELEMELEEEEEEEGESALWPWRLPGDIALHGFEGIAAGQISSSYLIEQYQKAAVHFSSHALRSTRFWKCNRSEELGDAQLVACGKESIGVFARRAYRRPLSEDESRRLNGFFDTVVATKGLETGIRLVVEGVLLSPQFLYMIESPNTSSLLKGYAVASRLSYFLWNSMPDEALFQAAAGGKLSTKQEVETQARRMLEHPRARKAVVHFHHQWLELDSTYVANADMNTYIERYLPEAIGAIEEEETLFVEAVEELWSSFLIGVRAAMVYETELFVEKTVFNGGGNLASLLTSNQGYITQFDSLAGEGLGTDRIYGVTESDIESGEEFERYLWDGNLDYSLSIKPATFPAAQRAGVLTMGAVLLARAHPVHPSPILRGVFLKERILCEYVGQPPQGAEGSAPPDTLEVDSTNRERIEAITAPAECNSCHKTINPLGFAFENFDSLGGWRTTDNSYPVDASGTLESGDSFSGPLELANKLSTSSQVHDCYALNWSRVAYGASAPNQENLAQVQKDFLAKQGDIRELLVSIVTSDSFRTISGGN